MICCIDQVLCGNKAIGENTLIVTKLNIECRLNTKKVSDFYLPASENSPLRYIQLLQATVEIAGTNWERVTLQGIKKARHLV